MTIQLHDFIEVEYTGKLTDGMVFDTTHEEVARKAHLPTENKKFGSLIICVGEQQILPGLDQQLAGKEIGKEFTINLQPEDAFGKRDIKKMRIVPANTFSEHKMNPYPGLQINVDGELGTVMRVSGGRIIVNFNHPLSGKPVIYHVKILRKITDTKEQLMAFINISLHIPVDKIKVAVVESKAVIQLPIQLPAQLVEILAKKLSELTKVDVMFGTQT